MNHFLIAVDPTDARVNVAGLSRYIWDNKDILARWNWLTGVFIVATNLDQVEITRRLTDIIGPFWFLVVRILDTSLSTGQLPPPAWEWLNTGGAGYTKQNPAAVPTGPLAANLLMGQPPVTRSPLADYLSSLTANYLKGTKKE